MSVKLPKIEKQPNLIFRPWSSKLMIEKIKIKVAILEFQMGPKRFQKGFRTF